jgi:WD40 repeat protein
MTRLPLCLLVFLSLAVPAVSAADALPEGARVRFGESRFGHSGVANWVAVLPDGKRLLTLGNHRLRVWDIASGKQESEFAFAQGAGLVHFSLSPDRKALATVNSLDRIVHIWDLATGKEDHQFPALPPNQAFYYIAYSPDGKSLLSYHNDRNVRIWDVATGKEERQLTLAPTVTPTVANAAGLVVTWMPDGKALAVLEEWSVRVIDPADGKELRFFGGHTAPIATIAFSPDGKLMATVASDRSARLWDVATAKTVAQLPLPIGGGRHLSFDGDGKLLAVGTADRTIRIFDVASAKQVGQIDPGAATVANFSLAKDGKTLFLVIPGEAIVRAYDVASGKELSPPTGHTGGIAAVSWSPDGKVLTTAGSTDRSIILWDAAGKMLRRLPPLEGHATILVQFAPDGKTLLSFGADRTVRIWDVAEGKELRSFMCSPLAVYSLTLHRDGKLLVLAGHDQKLRVWDVAEGKQLHRMDVKLPEGQRNLLFFPISFAGDRTLLSFSPYERGLIRRWDVVAGKELPELKGPPFNYGMQPSVSRDGKSLLTVNGTTVSLTELSSGQVRQTFTPQFSPPAAGAAPQPAVSLTAATLSPDSRTLAIALSDGTLHFWDTGSGKELLARSGLPLNCRLLLFAPDGKTLASAGPGTEVILWDVPGPAAEGRLAAKDVSADKLDELWKDLSGEDAARAWQAILTLETAPKEAVAFVQKNFKPGAALDDKGLAKLIGQLDAEQFQDREKATEELIRAGKPAEEAVKKALENKPSAEAKQRLEFILSKMAGKLGPEQDEIRVARGVEVLERIGTPEARKVLEELARGESKVSAEARAAVERLKAKSAAP